MKFWVTRLVIQIFQGNNWEWGCLRGESGGEDDYDLWTQDRLPELASSIPLFQVSIQEERATATMMKLFFKLTLRTGSVLGNEWTAENTFLRSYATGMRADWQLWLLPSWIQHCFYTAAILPLSCSKHVPEHGGLLMSALLKSLMSLLMSSTFSVLKHRLLLLFETFPFKLSFFSLFLS